MVATYNVFGAKIGSHWLAMATLATAFGAPVLMRGGGGGGAKKADIPPLNAGSQDEEKFIKEFMQNFEQEESKAKK